MTEYFIQTIDWLIKLIDWIKDNQFVIPIIIAGITIYLNNRFSYRLKVKEVKLSYKKLEKDKLLELNSILIDLTVANNSLFFIDRDRGLKEYVESLSIWLRRYMALSLFYKKNRPIFRKEITDEFDTTMKKLLTLASSIRAEIVEIKTVFNYPLDQIFVNEDDEKMNVSKYLNKLKSKAEISPIVNSFSTISDSIDRRFREILG